MPGLWTAEEHQQLRQADAHTLQHYLEISSSMQLP